MKIKSLTKEQMETMSYDDLAYVILREKGKKIKTVDIFKSICDSLDLSEKEYEDKIADFFTLLATEKRFVQLPKGYWDLRENHSVDVKINEDMIEDEEDDDIELELEASSAESEEKIQEEDEEFYDSDDDANDDIDDGLKDLVVMDDIEEENN